ncbi:coiled-coil domain-containing protein 90B, mitochondrial isoform X1 [Rhinoderma darwinii]|uniref:coiled-coil domain-containing protein 90B, mitochondrial isoform X1 n=1 Tax=Rhinoderma darwinii TaxID=43563 RepID=UPI003F673239
MHSARPEVTHEEAHRVSRVEGSDREELSVRMRVSGYRWTAELLTAAQRSCRRGFGSSAHVLSNYDVRQVEITPSEQRRLTFDTHALVRELETHGFSKPQSEVVVTALASLTNASLDTVYKDMVTRAQQEITLQQIMAHLDSIRKDMVILEKSEFATLRAENEKMKIEIGHVKQHLQNETNQIRAETKLDINLERSRLADMFTEQEKKLMETGTEFHKKPLSSLALRSLWDFTDSGSSKEVLALDMIKVPAHVAVLPPPPPPPLPAAAPHSHYTSLPPGGQDCHITPHAAYHFSLTAHVIPGLNVSYLHRKCLLYVL